MHYFLTLPATHFVFHLPCGPELAPSDFCFFTHLKQCVGSTHMGSDEVKKTVNSSHDKCLDRHGDYEEK